MNIYPELYSHTPTIKANHPFKTQTCLAGRQGRTSQIVRRKSSVTSHIVHSLCLYVFVAIFPYYFI
jgi:hypothetical protein